MIPNLQQYFLKAWLSKYESARDPESHDNVSSDEFLSIHVPDVGQGLSFDPLDEVIYAD